MIIRFWTYQVKQTDADRFEDFERREGIPMMQQQVGCQGVEMFCRLSEGSEGETLEYRLLSRWENMELLQTALTSQSWQDEVQLFLAQDFGEGNGTIVNYEVR
jgi:quinol monooxygenase YgiN